MKLSTLGMSVAIAISALSSAIAGYGQEEREVMKLWEKEAPGSKGVEEADIPTLTIYKPAEGKATGASVVVCPGGGYGMLADHEGKPVAEWLNSVGITSFVLKYRLGAKYRHPVMQNDVNRAIRVVRSNSEAWKIDPKRIGIIGFSAGGHLASTAATHFDAGDVKAIDPVERFSSRPDAAMLIYPVITMSDEFTHLGSKHNLLGEHPDAKLVELMSNEKQVTKDTPPTFIVHTLDDAVVPCENAIEFTRSCRKMGVPVELHLFEHGPHGFGLAKGDTTLGVWTGMCEKWLARRGFLK